jgi:pyrroline-5-carboxylate reductase
MLPQEILIIGGGRMGGAIAHGLIFRGHDPQHITVIEPNPTEDITQLGVKLNQHCDAFSSKSMIIVAVKPDKAEAVLTQLHPMLAPQTICVSVMAGIDLLALRTFWPLGRWGRMMPTIGVKNGQGVAGLYADDPFIYKAIEMVFSPIAKIFRLDAENDLHAVTALIGSGPAYFYAFTEALARAGRDLGLGPDMAMDMARETFVSAALLSNNSQLCLETLRQSVTSPKGTTEAGLNVLMAPLDDLALETLRAAFNRSKALSQGS